MTVYELNRDQLIELKQQYLIDTSADGNVSYGELADADNLVSDEEIFRAAKHIEFSPDDFSCSAGEDYHPKTCRLVVDGAILSEIANVLDNIVDQIEAGRTSGEVYDGSTWYIE